MERIDPYRVVVATGRCDELGTLRAALEASEQFTVVAEASTGLDALREVQRHKPDAVVLGSLLPKLHGLAALPLIRAASPATVIMLLTAAPSQRMSRIAAERGAAVASDDSLPPAALVTRLIDVVAGSRHPLSD